jgi:hypothetical protein
MMGLGGVVMLWLSAGPRFIGGVGFDIHTMLFAGLGMMVGLQSVLFWVFATIHGARERIVPLDPDFMQRLSIASLERGLILGAALLLVGLLLAAHALGAWGAQGFGRLDPGYTMRLAIPSAVLVMMGFQMIYAAFFVALLGVRGSGAAEPLPHERR